MDCNSCGGNTGVVNSRPQRSVNSVWRRRKCQECKSVFTTVEYADLSSSLRVSTHGDLEPFNRDKLLISVHNALKHRPKALEEATALTGSIVALVIKISNDSRINRDEIIQAAFTVLSRFDGPSSVIYQSYHPIKD